MDHVAIMQKKLGMIDLITSGKKTIESRWYMHKYAPWDRIYQGDTVYFKNSGEPVSLKASVGTVSQYADLKPEKAMNLLLAYYQDIGFNSIDREKWIHYVANKSYCILISLTDVKPLAPFYIDKRGYGSMSAWLTVSDIRSIKVR